jgi:flagellar biosynthesis repressor protein FlbT
MGLKIALKPHEKVIINGAVIQNGKSRCEFVVETTGPVLREKDILRSEEATTYCSKIYLAIQMMYIDGKNLAEYHNAYWTLVGDLVETVPSTRVHVARISQHLLKNDYYHALKAAKKLLSYEEELLNAQRQSRERL